MINQIENKTMKPKQKESAPKWMEIKRDVHSMTEQCAEIQTVDSYTVSSLASPTVSVGCVTKEVTAKEDIHLESATDGEIGTAISEQKNVPLSIQKIKMNKKGKDHLRVQI